MTAYAHVADGEVVRTGPLPRSWTNADGTTVSGFHLLDADVHRASGWLPLEDPGPPDHDPDTQTVVRSHEVREATVDVVYSVVALPAERREFFQREAGLAGAIATLREWADDAEATTATSGNAVQVLNVTLDRLAVFFDRFADLLENRR